MTGAVPDDDPVALEELELRPVDTDRLVAWLRRTGQRYFVAGDGHVGGLWSGCLVTFTVTPDGRALQVRGQWHREVAMERREELLALFDARHARTAWPKCFLLVLDDGTLRACADHSVLIGHGLSERQLERVMRVGLGGALSLAAELDRRYPDPVSRAPEDLA